MVSENHAAMLIECGKSKQLKNIRLYMDENKRPVFVEDVPPEEAEAFAAFEFAPAPVDLKVRGSQVIALFENTDETELEEMVAALGLLGATCVDWLFADDEEYAIVRRYCDGGTRVLYRMGDDESVDGALLERGMGVEALKHVLGERT